MLQKIFAMSMSYFLVSVAQGENSFDSLATGARTGDAAVAGLATGTTVSVGTLVQSGFTQRQTYSRHSTTDGIVVHKRTPKSGYVTLFYQPTAENIRSQKLEGEFARVESGHQAIEARAQQSMLSRDNRHLRFQEAQLSKRIAKRIASIHAMTDQELLATSQGRSVRRTYRYKDKAELKQLLKSKGHFGPINGVNVRPAIGPTLLKSAKAGAVVAGITFGVVYTVNPADAAEMDRQDNDISFVSTSD